MMALSKGAKIGIAIAAIVAIMIPTTIFVIVPALQKDDPTYPDWNLVFDGDVESVVNLTYQDLITGIDDDYSTATKNFTLENRLSMISYYDVKGFPLQTLMTETSVDPIDYEAMMFVASDGYSKVLTKTQIESGNSNEIIIAYNIDGEDLTGPDVEGDGYLRLMVNRSIVEKNQGYCISNLVEVRLLPKWDLEFVVDGVSTENRTYYDIVSGSDYNDIREEDLEFNATKNEGFYKEFTASGIYLWNLTQADYLNLDLTGKNMVNFTADDGYTKTLSLTALEDHWDEVIIAYQYDGEFLERPDDGNGPLRPAINKTVTDPDPSYSLCVSNLRTITFWTAF